MLPQDDPSWPQCNQTPVRCNDFKGTQWCEHVRQYLIDNKDADDLEPGMNYCLPIVPTMGLYAEFNLGTEIIAPEPRMVELSLVLADSAADLVELGLHVKGEGRIEVGYNVLAWAEAYAPAACAYFKHNYQQEMEVQQMNRLNDPADLKANMWCLAYHGMCLPCRRADLARRESELRAAATAPRPPDTPAPPVPPSNDAIRQRNRERRDNQSVYTAEQFGLDNSVPSETNYNNNAAIFNQIRANKGRRRG